MQPCAGRTRYLCALVALAALSLSACAAVGSSCPAWPVAGPEVADEMERLPEDQFPATWEWLGRLDVLRDQLEACE